MAASPPAGASQMSTDGKSWIVPKVSPGIERRHFLRQMAAAGLAAGAPAFPALAQSAPGHAMAGSGQEPLAVTLARSATELKYEDIPEAVTRIARRTILDPIGCAFGGYAAGPSRIAIKLASDVTSKQPATVLIS